jgi:hypothetical protein
MGMDQACPFSQTYRRCMSNDKEELLPGYKLVFEIQEKPVPDKPRLGSKELRKGNYVTSVIRPML